jgi:hypothetical protein
MATTTRRALLSFFLLCPLVLGIPLLGGRFETATDVQGILNLALDAAEIRESDETAEKLEIYKNGRYAYSLGKDGQQ